MRLWILEKIKPFSLCVFLVTLCETKEVGLTPSPLRVARVTEQEESSLGFENKEGFLFFLCDSVRDKRSWPHAHSPSGRSSRSGRTGGDSACPMKLR